MNFKDSSYFSNVRKNDQKKFQIFGKDFNVKNAEKKNSEKKNIFNFFSKKNTFFIVFLILFFSGEKHKSNQKPTKTDTKMCLCHIKNFRGKIT
jgi:hypothetical protein